MVQIGSNFIKNQWVAGRGSTFQARNPASGDVVWEGPSADAEDVAHALSVAREAFPIWAALSMDQRYAFLKAYADRLTARLADVADAISKDTGKPCWEAELEVKAMIGKIGISYAAYADRCPDIDEDGPVGRRHVSHRPHGVGVVLGPFNFPGHLPNGHIIPALLAGNTIVFKPSDYTPLTALEMIRCFQEADLPEGVLNVVFGGRETGQLLSVHPETDALFFTGGLRAGRQLAMLYARFPNKMLALELGGNNPLLLSKVDDLSAAVLTTIQSAFLTAGQRCTCARRLIICDSEQTQPFLDELVATVKRIKVGPYWDDPEPFMGPVIDSDRVDSLLSIQDWLQSVGAEVLVPMEELYPGLPFVTPAVLDVTQVSDRPDEEYFGPFLQVIRVPSLEEGIAIANQTEFGLSASLLARSEAEFKQFYMQIRAGVVNWNMPTTGASSKSPFGGVGLSGNFRPSAYYAADYCSFPVSSMCRDGLVMPESLPPGLHMESS